MTGSVSQSNALVLGPAWGGTREAIRAILRRRGHLVEYAPADLAVVQALDCIDAFDLLVLELDSQDLEAVQLCAQLRQVTLTPLLVVVPETGRSQGIRALELGADSFMVAPFDRRELVARAEALIRRYRLPVAPALAVSSVAGNSPASRR
ncbi:MAG TPA: hypothetical protein PKM78_03470 [Anaerolineae bacterium]|nr:hypothetical protein [Anaerolineae bacterium]